MTDILHPAEGNIPRLPGTVDHAIFYAKDAPVTGPVGDPAVGSASPGIVLE